MINGIIELIFGSITFLNNRKNNIQKHNDDIREIQKLLFDVIKQTKSYMKSQSKANSIRNVNEEEKIASKWNNLSAKFYGINDEIRIRLFQKAEFWLDPSNSKPTEVQKYVLDLKEVERELRREIGL